MATIDTTVPGTADDAPEYFSLPQEYYTGEWHELDLEVIFRRRWLFAGHASSIPNPGDYFLFELGDDSYIVVRDADGTINALANVCRHRGSRICAEPSGEGKKRLTCPYHAWSYGLDGSLRTAPRMQEEFDKSQYQLRRAWVDEWYGMVFVCLDRERPEPLANRFDGVDLGPWRLDATKVAADETYEVAADWKLVSENFIECYHCSVNHPELCQVFDPGDSVVGEKRLSDASEIPSRVRETDDDYFSFSAEGTLRPGAQSFTMDGEYAVSKLLGDPGDPPPERDSGLFSFPNFNTVAVPDYFLTFSWLPAGPRATRFRATWVVHEDAEEGRDYDAEQLKALFEVTAQEDVDLSALGQQGVNGAAYEPGPYNERLEAAVISWMRVYHSLHRQSHV